MTSPKGKKISHHRGGHYGNSYILFDSIKNQCIIECESELEHTMFVSLETNPKVEMYVSHPIETIINGENDNCIRAMFDAYVKYKDKTEELIECKYIDEIEDPSEKGDRSRKQRKIHELYCNSKNINYRVITDQDLYQSKVRFSNNLQIIHSIKLIYSNEIYRKEIHSKSRVLLKKILQAGTTTIDSLLQFEIVNEIMDQLMYLSYRGEIEMDLDTKSISKNTEVRAI